METEREKVLPFVIGPHTSNVPSEVEQNSLEMACKELPTEPLAKVKYYFIWEIVISEYVLGNVIFTVV